MEGMALDKELETLKVIVDTREQDGELFQKRMARIGYPIEREKLDFGDYSVRTEHFTLKNKVAIERKMNLDELAMCFGSQRKRFNAEFERAKANDGRLWLLCENGTWDAILNDTSYKMRCRSKYGRNAFLASILAWSIRYGMKPIFVGAEQSGSLIREILYREMREYLSGLDKD